MLNPIRRLLTSYKASIILMLIYIVLMTLSTIIEKHYGTPFAKAMVYYSPLFILLQLLLVGNIIGITITKWKTLSLSSYFFIHLAFVIILTGAAVTHFFSTEGIMSLREGETTNKVYDPKTQHLAMTLPFTVILDDFRLIRYPGSNSPSSYESDLTIHTPQQTTKTKIFMNNVLDMQGYRFFQASYHEDEQGSILSVSRDTLGRNITYTGYLLLILSLIANLFNKRSRFRRLIRFINRSAALLVLLLCSPTVFAQNDIPTSHIQAIETLPVLKVSGRVAPLSAVASEIVRKLNKQTSINGFQPTAFIVSITTDPRTWMNQRIILIDNKEFSTQCQLPYPYLSYRDAFDAKGDYRFSKQVETAYHKQPAQRNHNDKEWLKIDEKINLLHMLFNYQLLRLYPLPADTLHNQWFAPGSELHDFSPTDSTRLVSNFRQYLSAVRLAYVSHDWTAANQAVDSIKHLQLLWANKGLIQPQKLKAEVQYEEAHFFHYIKRIYLIAGALLLLLALAIMLRPHEDKKQRTLFYMLFTLTIALAMLCHLYAIALRWYISGYAPWSNSYETMLCLSLSVILLGTLFIRKSPIVPALSSILAGVILFVAGLNWMDPQITPLVPVLKSPWLMFHVAVLILGYGFFGLSAMIGTADLLMTPFTTSKNKSILAPRLKNITAINEVCMIGGLAFSTVGILLGAVWANESWGRYWSWDPKETWALITAIIYAVVLHYRWFKRGNTDRTFNFMAQWAFLSVLMTYFGVNYFLSGMHSYGESDILARIPLWGYTLFAAFFLLPPICAFTIRRQ